MFVEFLDTCVEDLREEIGLAQVLHGQEAVVKPLDPRLHFSL